MIKNTQPGMYMRKDKKCSSGYYPYGFNRCKRMSVLVGDPPLVIEKAALLTLGASMLVVLALFQ